MEPTRDQDRATGEDNLQDSERNDQLMDPAVDVLEPSEGVPLVSHNEATDRDTSMPPNHWDFGKSAEAEERLGTLETQVPVENGQETKLVRESKSVESEKAMFYGVDDRPAWYFSAMLGLQHYLIVTSGALSYPFALAPALCMREEDPARGYLISTIFFISGIGTLIQTTFGIRLPIIQGCSVTFLVPILATMALPEWRCPTEEQLVAARPSDSGLTGPATDEEWTQVWQTRMSEVRRGLFLNFHVVESRLLQCR
ncbi:putative purine permease [Ixodes scapularis]